MKQAFLAAAALAGLAATALACDKCASGVVVQGSPCPALVESSNTTTTVTTAASVAPAAIATQPAQVSTSVAETTVPVTVERTQYVPQVTQETVNVPAKTYTTTVLDAPAVNSSVSALSVNGFNQLAFGMPVTNGVTTVTTSSTNAAVTQTGFFRNRRHAAGTVTTQTVNRGGRGRLLPTSKTTVKTF